MKEKSKKEIEDNILKGLSPEQIALIKTHLKKEMAAAIKHEEDVAAVRPVCKMKVCEDPETGQIKVVYQKGCPKGYIERIAGSVATRGIAFEQAKEEEKEKELKR